LTFDVGQGTQDIGFRNETAVLFESARGVEVVLNVLDDDGTPTMGQFVIRDGQGRVYPARSRRLAPDFFFHDQIYRQHGEMVVLAAGDVRGDLHARAPSTASSAVRSWFPRRRVMRKRFSSSDGSSWSIIAGFPVTTMSMRRVVPTMNHRPKE
jgi:hypothetical protein